MLSLNSVSNANYGFELEKKMYCLLACCLPVVKILRNKNHMTDDEFFSNLKPKSERIEMDAAPAFNWFEIKNEI